MFLLIIVVPLFVILLLIINMRAVMPELSLNELRRRSKHSQKYTQDLKRLELAPLIESARKLKQDFIIVILVLLLLATFGWLIGSVVSILMVFACGPISKIPPFASLSKKIYSKYEPLILSKIEAASKFLKFIGQSSSPRYTPQAIASKEELNEHIENSHQVLSQNEKKLLLSALSFPSVIVSSIMTPRNEIDSVKKTEFLGPLVLSELHSLGHSRLPVVDSDIDHIIGILHLRDLMSLDIKRSVTAERAMEKKVYYIHDDNTAEHALAAFLKTRHHLFVVINQHRETVGLLTLEDVLESLIGKKIVDEDDITGGL